MFQNYKNLKISISTKKDGNMRLVGNDVKNNLKNRQRYFKKRGFDQKKVTSAKLVGGNKIKIVGNKNGDRIIENTDGLITNEKNVFLSITIADCLPVFLYEEKQKVTALLHCGWQGLDKQIIEKTLDIFSDKFNSQKSNIKVAIGPGICKDCYEIGEKLENKFKDYHKAIVKKDNKMFLDLKKIAKMKLMEEGIKRENIEVSQECTCCMNGKYFSYRRDKLKNIEVGVVVFRRMD